MKIWKKQSPAISPFELGRYEDFSRNGWQDEAPVHEGLGARAPARRRGPRFAVLRRYRYFMLFVLLPTLLATGYYGLIASDQYVSEARYLVRGRQSSGPSALSSLLPGISTGPAREDAQGVRDYLESHDAVAALQQKFDLTAMYRRPEADLLSRLWESDPSAEQLLRYYRQHISAEFDTADGITTLEVRAFRPEDAKAIADRLLALSENLVNKFSQRAQDDTLRVAHDEVSRAEQRVLNARAAITTFRQREQAMDPARSAVMAVDTIGRLEAALVAARAELREKSAYLRADNPVISQLQNRVSALTSQAAAERERLTNGDATVAQQIADYERLLLEREFADKQLASATASLENARMEAARQQLFLVRVVEPNTAQEALYPRRLFIIGSLFIALSVLYGIGWLIIAGVREHAA